MHVSLLHDLMTFAKKNYKFIVSVVDDTCLSSVLFLFCCVQEDVNTMLLYSLNVCMSLIQNRHFRNTVLLLLTKLYMGLKTPDYINVCQVRPALISDHLFPVHLVSMPTYICTYPMDWGTCGSVAFASNWKVAGSNSAVCT